MSKFALLIVVLFVLFTSVFAQNQIIGSIKGSIVDEAGAALAGVNIIVEGTRQGTVSSQNGEFNISYLPQGNYSILFEFIGYELVKIKDLTVLSDKIIDLGTIRLKEKPLSINEIVVTPGSYSIMGDETATRQTLSAEDIKIMGWAEDITRAVQRIPGTASDDFAAQFSIRGGDVDEILVLLDGMQLYKPFHQKDFGGGLYSTIDIETIAGVDMLTGGFGAEYGDRMSGVLNMRTKTPQEVKSQTSVGLSIMNVRAFSMGTFSNSNTSWLFSVRYGYLDLINQLMGNVLKLHPRYYDFLGKMQFKLNEKHSLAVYGFLANDNYKMDEKVKEPKTTWYNIDYVKSSYGNNYGWMTLNSAFSAKVYARTIVYGGSVTKDRYWNQFDNDPQYHLNSATIDGKRDLGLYGIKQDWDFQPSKSLMFKFGLDYKKLSAKYNYSKNINDEFITANDSLTNMLINYQADKNQDGTQLGLHFSVKYQILSPLTMEAGIRYDNTSFSGDKLWSPRIGMAYSFAKSTVLRAGWGYYYQMQGIDELNIQFEDLTYHPAKLAEHYVLGFEHQFQNGLHFRVEGYHKKMSNLRNDYYTFRDIDEFFPEARTDLIKLISDKANATGVEFLVKYDIGSNFSWWASYVLSEAKDNVTDIIFNGRLIKRTGELPRAWDQTHVINLDGNYRFNERWHLNVSWQYRTGRPNTIFTVERKQRDDGSFAYFHDYGVFRGSRVPAYHRLDARINRHFYTSYGKITAFLHVINLYDHENIIHYDHDILSQDANKFKSEIVPETWFGIMPFAGVSWEF